MKKYLVEIYYRYLKTDTLTPKWNESVGIFKLNGIHLNEKA